MVAGASKTWEVAIPQACMMGKMLVGEASVKNLSGTSRPTADYAGKSASMETECNVGVFGADQRQPWGAQSLAVARFGRGHLMYYL